jgi:hypothetical protein
MLLYPSKVLYSFDASVNGLVGGIAKLNADGVIFTCPRCLYD